MSTNMVSDRYAGFLKAVDKIHDLLRTKIGNRIDLEDVIARRAALQDHLSEEYRSKPESFTKENIIEELLEFLGYGKGSRAGESELKKAFGRNYPDYKLLASQDFYLLVEAEPLNKDLESKLGGGVRQVITWIQDKGCDTDFGVATDGFRWVLVEFLVEKRKARVIKRVDLSPFFAEKIGHGTLVTEKSKRQLVEEFLDFFSKDRIEKKVSEQEVVLEYYQERVSKKFYDEYMRLVFGDRKSGICLVDSITGIEDRQAREKIAQAVVDRLIFIKFIEAKGWMRGDKNFLINLWNTYRKAQTGSFYDSYLRILFFNVLNNPIGQRAGAFAGIKYLNGGLFRRIKEEELFQGYSIEDDIIAKLITFLENYYFGEEGDGEKYVHGEQRQKKDVMSPEILGYIFERTANHEKGAYYTPAGVTEFIASGTLQSLVLDRFNTRLEKKGVYPAKKIENALVDGSLSRNELASVYDEICSIKILDPACGSGAFFMPIIGILMKVRYLLAQELGLQFNEYKAKKEIIENSIFGVDINEHAIEIAKLRLWLELASSVENLDEVELLPNIEYNIMAGNSLLGFDTLGEVPSLQKFMPLDIRDQIRAMERIDPARADRMRELCERPSLMNILQIRDMLVRLYKSVKDPTLARQISEVIGHVHLKLQKQMSEYYFSYLNGLPSTKNQIDEKNLAAFNVFHWILQFHDVFLNGGFDVVLGNPPYIENAMINYPLSHFKTSPCGNVYAPFFERAVSLAKHGGYFGYIVPISAICTERMKTLQKLLIENTSMLKTSNFDDRPDKIFKGLEHCRSSIIVGKRRRKEVDGKEANGSIVLSTHYHRWYAEERDRLFRFMSFVDVTAFVKEGIIPKIGNPIELSIIRKIQTNKPLKSFIVKDSKLALIYHNAPQYWIRVMDFMPEFSNERGDKISPHNKSFYVSDDVKSAEDIIAALNSSLFYWFFIVNSDCRDLTMREIENFPLDVTSMTTSSRSRLKALCARLMTDYREHSQLKKTSYAATGEVSYREFYPKESKPILDKIDDVLAEHYSFTKDERDYIKGFDLRFRMGSGL